MINITSSEKTNVPINEKKKYKWGKKEKILGLIVLFIFIIMFVVSSSGDKTPEKESQKLALDVNYTPYEQGYSVPVLTIKNQNDVSWESCRIRVNGSYEMTLPTIFESSYWNQPEITGRKYQLILITQLTKSDGTIFNPLTTAVQDICISCDKPNYNSNCWSK
jgi:hypothetical protein